MNPRRNIQAHRQRRRRMVIRRHAKDRAYADEMIALGLWGDGITTYAKCSCRVSDKGICTWCYGTRRLMIE